MSGLYASDGTLNVNVVTGTSFVGRQGSNGGLNVIQVPGTSFTGLQHISGAINVFNATADVGTHQHPCGAQNITNSGKHNARSVTVLTGALT